MRYIHIQPDARWVEDVTAAIVSTLQRSLAQSDVVSFVLSGGGTPRAVYQHLALHYAHALPWERVHLFWGDERYVPFDDPRSNYGMALNTLIRHLPIPTENVHPIPTYMHTPSLAAQAYEVTLHAYFPQGRAAFDLLLLGMGPDCHTASLFPHSPALHVRDRWVVDAPGVDVRRITLTYPALNDARTIFLLVRGEGKAETVRKALGSPLPVEECPVQGVNPSHGDIHWWLDQSAASRLKSHGGEVEA